MKYLKKFALLFVICFVLSTIVAFAPPISVTINENLKINFNGKAFQTKDENGEDVNPLTYNDRTYLPARAILEKTGVFVDYDEASETVILKSENTLLSRANLVLHYLKYKDLKQLATLAHPAKGVTFSPYADVSDESLNFSAADIKKLDDTKLYHWGEFDGSGHPMNLSFSDYYNRFIYPADFINAERIGNNTIMGRGTTINTIAETYPNGKFIEYNFDFPSSETNKNGLNMTGSWQSLRLVFEEADNEWYLVAIVHDCWTT